MVYSSAEKADFGGTPKIEDMDVRQGFSNLYPFADQNFGKNFGSFADKWRKIFENIYPKMPKNEFLAVYLCIIEKIS